MSNFDTILIKGKMLNGSMNGIQIVEQGTIKSTSYKVGQVRKFNDNGEEWEVTEILPYPNYRLTSMMQKQGLKKVRFT